MLTWDGQAEIEIEFRAPSLAAANQMEEDDGTANEEEGTCKAELKQALATIERQAAELRVLRGEAASGKNTAKARKAGGAALAARRMQGQQDDGAVALTTVRATRTPPCCVGLTTSPTAWLAALQVGGAPAACAVSPCDLRGACLHGVRSQAAPPPSALNQAHHCHVSLDADADRELLHTFPWIRRQQR